MRLANKIQKQLINFATGGGYEIVIPNFYFGIYEMDLFRLTNSEIIYEYEIKISRSDFFADFKKKFGNETKHSRFENKSCACNKFFFVVPENMVGIEEVPSYAGLIYYLGGGFKIIKAAPMLKKKDKINYQSLAKSLAWRDQLTRQKLNQIKRQFDEYKKQFLNR